VLQIVTRKLANNLWMVLCLLLGSILAVGMVCSIPIYSDGILQRMLTKDLEQAQQTTAIYPGYIAFENYVYNVDVGDTTQFRATMVQKINDMASKMPNKPLLSSEYIGISNLYHEIAYEQKSVKYSFGLGGQTGFQDHITIVKGRMFQANAADGVIEVIANAAALSASGMVMDREYELHSYRQKDDAPALMKVKIVGLYETKGTQDVYWYQRIYNYNTTLMMDMDQLAQISNTVPEMPLYVQKVYAAFDYHQFSIKTVRALENVCKEGVDYSIGFPRTTKFTSTFQNVIQGYAKRSAELKLTLQVMIVPILLMLIFYIFMVSQLKVRNETSVISVLESRGAGKSQIMLLYLLESFVLGIITLAVGPPLGYYMVRIIGSANGFLEFVNRKALTVSLDSQAMMYGLVAVCLIIVTTLLPVLQWSGVSIVQQKQKKSRLGKAPFWQRFFLDIVLIGISLYSLNRLKAQLNLQKSLGLAGTESNLDFLLFLASTLFILGSGLLLLRLHPLILRLLAFIGRRFWSPVLYLSFHQIGRSSGQSQFLMIFLILALSIGLFNANAARTINRNMEDNINCGTGADIRLREYWQPLDKNGTPIVQSDTSTAEPQEEFFYEPDFARFSAIDGVAHAARVYQTNDVKVTYNRQTVATSLMAIDPYDFAQTAWNRSNMNRYTMNEYMNVMTKQPRAVILSSNMRDKLGLQVGDTIIFRLYESDNVEGVIVAFIDTWPGYQSLSYDKDGKVVEKTLVIASLQNVLANSPVKPYQVWLKKADGVSDKDLYSAIETTRIKIQWIQSAGQQIITARNDPQLQGTNGALTLGFIVSMLICAVGFLIYWILSVQGRTLQFGILRAIGLGKGSIISLLISEQVLISGAAILFGVILGNLTSWLYVPLFQLVYSSTGQYVPFRVISEASDAAKIYVVLGCLLAACLLLLIRLILVIRVDQAVKLGEE
jgi:putative ABC transport system permease protein